MVRTEIKMANENIAIFLDRDGVINKEVGYLSNPEDFELLEGTTEALKILKEKGYLLFIITNQAGVARGYYSEEILSDIHNKLNLILKESDISLDGIYYCPHHPKITGDCECRKPKPGMIFKARDKFKINLQKSYMVGDTMGDIEAGNNAQCKTVLVMTGYGKEERSKIGDVKPDLIFDSLLEFAKNL